jgi:cytochrome c oxidase assembly protein subunit 16
MAVFPSKKYKSAADANTIASRYRSLLAKHPFALFGLPFIATMVAGSFFLTPATAIRYEKHDRKVRRLTKEEELGIGKAGRRVDMKEEYYVRPQSPFLQWFGSGPCVLIDGCFARQRLAAKDLDDWEQKRVKRLPGEHDGVI